ncbi:transposase (fragment) [uncultured Stenotrophomonas sp.]|uniref:Transposase n=1 Tax=uncultured Stenotrophomonas sp. TaxID=165438 RepID=A0A1Y5Q3R4_9GAMM
MEEGISPVPAIPRRSAAVRRGKPSLIRCDNGPEYISGALLAWPQPHDIRIEHFQPGKPQQNAHVERYNRTVRYAWLARTLFDTIEQVQVQTRPCTGAGYTATSDRIWRSAA